MNMKRILILCAIIAALTLVTVFSACNVTRTVTTKSEYFQRGDTSCAIVTKTTETYDATKKVAF